MIRSRVITAIGLTMTGTVLVIVLSNLDPPTGEELGTAIARALR